MKTDTVRTKRSFWQENRRSGGYLLKKNVKSGSISLFRWLLVFGLCFMIIQPLLMRLTTSFMIEQDLYDSTVIMLPRTATLDNYRIVFELLNLPKAILNSLWTSLLMAVCQVISTTLVGYGFARYDFPLKKFWFGCVVALIIIPPQTMSMSLYVFFTNFDIFGIFKAINGKPLNLRGSVAPYTLMSLTCMGLKNGLYIYMLRQYFRGVPKSLEEAAYVDGCGTLRTFFRIMLPDAVPIILSCFLFAFVWQWTDLFYTRNFLSSYSLLSNELNGIVTRMGHYFATTAGTAVIVPPARRAQLISIGVLICATPLIILYLFAQRTFVESITMTGTKM
ncbi:MAG: carbohydrate ABC transporter permease [Clostridia bacterium]|nr:carbohydrate ABC transporter permease [Clostridia bacterium]